VGEVFNPNTDSRWSKQPRKRGLDQTERFRESTWKKKGGRIGSAASWRGAHERMRSVTLSGDLPRGGERSLKRKDPRVNRGTVAKRGGEIRGALLCSAPARCSGKGPSNSGSHTTRKEETLDQLETFLRHLKNRTPRRQHPNPAKKRPWGMGGSIRLGFLA